MHLCFFFLLLQPQLHAKQRQKKRSIKGEHKPVAHLPDGSTLLAELASESDSDLCYRYYLLHMSSVDLCKGITEEA